MDAVNFTAWEGKQSTSTGCVTAQSAALIAATLRSDLDDAPGDGEALPPLWHWCAFPQSVPYCDLASDGHPPLGAFLPPVPLSRRMWASGRLTFHAPLHVGDILTRTSTLRAVSDKSTPDRPMVFVTVDHAISGPKGVVIEEQQTIVYQDIAPVFTPPAKRPMPDTARHASTQTVDSPRLFRFSAITFNAHKIHYDRPYARDVEHYPDLVIHGPLQAMLLMQVAVDTHGTPPTGFEFRGVHPMFLGADLDLMACDHTEGCLQLYSGQSGHQGMQARANWGTTA